MDVNSLENKKNIYEFVYYFKIFKLNKFYLFKYNDKIILHIHNIRLINMN